MKNVTLPRYTIGPDALNNLERVVSAYGRKVALIHGAKALCRLSGAVNSGAGFAGRRQGSLLRTGSNL